jgi:hypothetical protein
VALDDIGPSIIRDGLDYVYEQADEKAKTREARHLSWLSDARMNVFEFDGEIKERPIAPTPRAHTVDSTFDLILAANTWGTKGAIWLSENCVVLVIDDGDRRETVRLPLKKTDTFLRVEQLAKTPKLEQADLVRLLRREFRNSPQQATVLSAVRKIKFSRGETGFSDIQHGNESMGKSVEAEVTGAGEIPDSLTLPVVVYANPGERENVVTVAFDLEISVHEQRFVLKPLPDETVIAVQIALANIRKAISAGAPKDIPILYGTP